MRILSYTQGWVRQPGAELWNYRADSCGAGAMVASQCNLEKRFKLENLSLPQKQYENFIEDVLSIAKWEKMEYDAANQTITWEPNLHWYAVYALLTLVRYPSENPEAVRAYSTLLKRGFSKDVAMFFCAGADEYADDHAFAMNCPLYWKLPADLSISNIVKGLYSLKSNDVRSGFWVEINKQLGVVSVAYKEYEIWNSLRTRNGTAMRNGSAMLGQQSWPALQGLLTPEVWEFMILDKPYEEKKAIHTEMLAKKRPNGKTYVAVSNL